MIRFQRQGYVSLWLDTTDVLPETKVKIGYAIYDKNDKLCDFYYDENRYISVPLGKDWYAILTAYVRAKQA